MIKFLSNWIEQITIAIIITGIFELILPNGNIKKYIKVVLGIYVVFCIISPFVNNKELFDFKDLSIKKNVEIPAKTTSSKVNQESMDRRLEQIYIDELKKDIKKQVEEKGYEILKIDIDANLNPNTQNSGIKKINLIIEKKEGNLANIEKIDISIGNVIKQENLPEVDVLKEKIANYYEIDKGIINIKAR